jgi:hypothetical protein
MRRQARHGGAGRQSGNWPCCAAGSPWAEETLTDALAAMKQAEGAFDAASDRFDAAERALDAAREERAQTRRDRYAARQA